MTLVPEEIVYGDKEAVSFTDEEIKIISYKNNTKTGTVSFHCMFFHFALFLFCFNTLRPHSGLPSIYYREAVPFTDEEIKIISYKNNTKTGTAQVTVQGIGRYYGTKTLKFTDSFRQPCMANSVHLYNWIAVSA